MKKNRLIQSFLALGIALSSIISPMNQVTAKADIVYNSGDSYKLVTSVKAYISASDAANGINAVGTRSAGSYYVYKSFAGMLNISAYKGSAGAWIDPAKNVAADPTPTPEPTPTVGSAYTLNNSLSGYTTAFDAKTGVNAVSTLSAGKYYIYKIYNGMYNISKYVGSPGAWINPAKNGSAQPEPDQDTVAAKVLATAHSLLGAPYVYGGESWSEGGFDCSGLTQYSYRQAGISIPRTASQQWYGIANKVSNPRPGDIIAFIREGSIYHVGIYLGNNEMIHAPKPGEYVEIKNLDWYYRNNRVKGFLRPGK